MPYKDKEKQREYHHKYNYEWYEKNKAERNKQQYEYRTTHKAKISESYKKYRATHKAKIAEYQRGLGYGCGRMAKWKQQKISIDTYGQFLTLLAMANYRCEICNIELTERTTHLDHDHNNGRVRGILCQKCNQGLGNFQDSCIALKQAVQYLE